jgi:hypothetical protein
LHCHKFAPWHTTPPMPDPSVPTPPDDSEDGAVPLPSMATFWPEDNQQDIVSRGIKVRDFAYPADRVGHRTPTHPHPMALCMSRLSTYNELYLFCVQRKKRKTRSVKRRRKSYVCRLSCRGCHSS